MDLLNSVLGSIDEDTQQILLEWPPFFTCFLLKIPKILTFLYYLLFRIQSHAEIRAKQLKYWSEIVFSFFRKTKTHESSFSQLNQASFALFQENSLGYPSKTL